MLKMQYASFRTILWILIILTLVTNISAKKGGGGGKGTSGGKGTAGKGTSGSKPGSSGSHKYPPSTGLSGNNYRPPQKIQFGNQQYPVAQTKPPQYIYTIRDSGSRYNNLLTGLSLWNLGRLSSTNQANKQYNQSADETCKFAIRHANRTYEERTIRCSMISSFIWEWESKPNVTQPVSSSNATIGNNVTHTNETVTINVTSTSDALEDKGAPIFASPGMTCYVIRILRAQATTKEVPCQLLQEYTQSSWTNSAGRLTPALVIFAIQFMLFKIL